MSRRPNSLKPPILATSMVALALVGIAAAQSVQSDNVTDNHVVLEKRTSESAMVYTSSEDGRTIYAWQPVAGKPPRYIGESVAVLDE